MEAQSLTKIVFFLQKLEDQMITHIVSDFSRVLLFPRDRSTVEKLNTMIKRVRLEENYSFFDYFDLNDELLRFYQSLQPAVQTVIFTSGEIQEETEVKSRIAGIVKYVFSAQYHQRSKETVSSYAWLAEQLQTTSQQMLFVDDSSVNIAAAKQAGVRTVQFLNTEQTIVTMRKSLGEQH
jgi:HAD superfamily hydrolase (TIGR01509 family)